MPVNSSLDLGTPESAGVVATLGVRVPMRDGASLHAVVWRPRHADGPVPLVMELTPYGVDHLHPDGVFWAINGFAYAALDVRGRGASDGDFLPFASDALDGYDAIEWFAAQSWCDGRVVLHGGSYTGINQYLIMAAAPPSLKALTPDSTSGLGVDLPPGGIPALYDFNWRRLVANRGTQFVIAGDVANWHAQMYEALEAGTSLVEAARAAGAPIDDDVLRFVDHPEPGPAWEDLYAQPHEFAASAVPVLSITGMSDDSSGGTIANWRRFTANAPADVVAKSHLVVGPWDHMGTHFGEGRVGELVFGPAATVDLPALRRDWLRHVLDGAPLPEFLSDRVMLYVAGAERWAGASSLEAATTATADRWLRGVDGPMDATHSGFVEEAPADGVDATFTCDPHDLRTARTELERRPDGSGPASPFHGQPMNNFLMSLAGNDPTNSRFVVELDGNGAVYTSRPIAEDLVVVGWPELHLHVVCDQPDADLAVLVHEVSPAGDTILLSSEPLRLSCRHHDGGHDWLVPGEVTAISMTHFKWCQRRVRAGSRLRVAIRHASSIQVNAFPHGRPADAPAAVVRVLHDAARAPRLVLPLSDLVG
jgi:putative CocE/NonD family hydrolase